MNLQRLFSIIRKETAQLLRDRRTLGTIITLPIIQMVLYGYLSNEVLHQPTAGWDQSVGTESRARGCARRLNPSMCAPGPGTIQIYKVSCSSFQECWG